MPKPENMALRLLMSVWLIAPISGATVKYVAKKSAPPVTIALLIFTCSSCIVPLIYLYTCIQYTNIGEPYERNHNHKSVKKHT